MNHHGLESYPVHAVLSSEQKKSQLLSDLVII